MSRIVKCDRCGVIFPKDSDNSGYIKMGWRSIRGADLYIDPNPYEDFDFCESCMEEIRACVERVPKIEPKKAEPEKKPAPVNKLSNDDIGKIRALRKAGRTVAWIADDMGLSEPTVRKYIKMAEAEA